MKKYTLVLFCFLLLLSNRSLRAAYFERLPFEATQPDGTLVHCFISGDEYYNWLHDEAGYTLLWAEDGFFYYAEKQDEQLIATRYKFNSINPAAVGLQPWLRISENDYRKRVNDIVENRSASDAPHSGAMNNLVIYIRFSDDTEFSTTRLVFDSRFNSMQESSMASYYSEVSYNRFSIHSTHYPACPLTSNLSFQDSHPHAYFKPYNATSNPIGYYNTLQQAERENALISDAVNWINQNSPVDPSLNLDSDSNGRVDDITFIIRGSNTTWGSLLWAHQNTLQGSINLFINGLRVRDYTFIPETQSGVKTLCHETFHILGAPDLYHYNDGGLGISPVSDWDLMGTGGGHMSAFLKWKYTNKTWIEHIPQIYISGTYTLSSLADADSNCYMILSPLSANEYFIVEYRRKSGLFETNLPGTGLLVYRIDNRRTGNSSGPPDEVYIYRPGGTTSTNGNPFQAYYSAESGRTAISDQTQPSGFLQNGSSGGLQISNITSAGNTISFNVIITLVQSPPVFTATATATNQIKLNWQKNLAADNVLIAAGDHSILGEPQQGIQYAEGNMLPGGGRIIYYGNADSIVHNSLQQGTKYYYKIWSVSDTLGYSKPATASETTFCGVAELPLNEHFDAITIPGCWTQQIFGSDSTITWSIALSNGAGGEPNEIRSRYNLSENGTTRFVSPPLNTLGVASLKLKFRHMFYTWMGGLHIKVQTSSDRLNWVDEQWSVLTNHNNIPAQLIETTVGHNLNSPKTYIAFTVQGNLTNYVYWYIDDVFVSATNAPVFNIQASVSPPQAAVLSGAGNYIQGENVNLISNGNGFLNFLNWSENGVVVSTNEQMAFKAEASRSLVANYSAVNVFVEALSTDFAAGETSGTGYFIKGDNISISAFPKAGFKFANWVVNDTIISLSPVFSFIADSSTTLYARFIPEYFRVTTAAFPASGGTVSRGSVYVSGDIAIVTAFAAEGWNFAGFFENGLQVCDSAVFTFSVLTNHAIEARFTPQLQVYSLQVTINPPGAGTIAGSGSYAAGTQANVTASAAKGWVFDNWEEQGSSISNDTMLTLLMSADRNLIANFSKTIQVIAEAYPPEGGFANGSGTYRIQSEITLEASANQGFRFIHWIENNATVSENSLYTFTGATDRSFVAVFQKENGMDNGRPLQTILFPNPTHGIVFLRDCVQSFTTVNVSTADGRLVKTLPINVSSDCRYFDLSGIAPGMYQLSFNAASGSYGLATVILLK